MGILNPPKSAAATGLLHGALDGNDEDEDGKAADESIGADLNSGDLPNNSKSTEDQYMLEAESRRQEHQEKEQKQKEEEEEEGTV